eukprot:scaffold4129_cov88-Isochrysis_galbana.AAC.2
MCGCVRVCAWGARGLRECEWRWGVKCCVRWACGGDSREAHCALAVGRCRAMRSRDTRHIPSAAGVKAGCEGRSLLSCRCPVYLFCPVYALAL